MNIWPWTWWGQGKRVGGGSAAGTEGWVLLYQHSTVAVRTPQFLRQVASVHTTRVASQGAILCLAACPYAHMCCPLQEITATLQTLQTTNCLFTGSDMILLIIPLRLTWSLFLYSSSSFEDSMMGVNRFSNAWKNVLSVFSVKFNVPFIQITYLWVFMIFHDVTSFSPVTSDIVKHQSEDRWSHWSILFTF